MSWLANFRARMRWHCAGLEREHADALQRVARFAMDRDGDIDPANENHMERVDDEDRRWRRLKAFERIEAEAIRIYQEERLCIDDETP